MRITGIMLLGFLLHWNSMASAQTCGDSLRNVSGIISGSVFYSDKHQKSSVTLDILYVKAGGSKPYQNSRWTENGFDIYGLPTLDDAIVVGEILLDDTTA